MPLALYTMLVNTLSRFFGHFPCSRHWLALQWLPSHLLCALHLPLISQLLLAVAIVCSFVFLSVLHKGCYSCSSTSSFCSLASVASAASVATAASAVSSLVYKTRPEVGLIQHITPNRRQKNGEGGLDSVPGCPVTSVKPHKEALIGPRVV